MRCLPISVVAVIAFGTSVLFGLHEHYKYTHWPRNADYTALVSFADQQLKPNSANIEVPNDLWPEAVRKLKPTNVYLDRTTAWVSIVLHHGGAFRGDTEFRVVPSGYMPEKLYSRDVILPTSHPRVFRIDSEY